MELAEQGPRAGVRRLWVEPLRSGPLAHVGLTFPDQNHEWASAMSNPRVPHPLGTPCEAPVGKQVLGGSVQSCVLLVRMKGQG